MEGLLHPGKSGFKDQQGNGYQVANCPFILLCKSNGSLVSWNLKTYHTSQFEITPSDRHLYGLIHVLGDPELMDCAKLVAAFPSEHSWTEKRHSSS